MRNKIWLTPLLILILSSCRFGNYSEEPKRKESFKQIDLYRTTPAQLATAVIYNDSSPMTVNETTPLSGIPTSVLNTFSDPLYYAIQNDQNQTQLFIGSNQSSFLATFVDANRKIDTAGETEWGPLWESPDCRSKIVIYQEGKLNSAGKGSEVTLPDGSKSVSSGRVEMAFSQYRYFDGNCEAELSYLAQCYLDGSGCTSNEIQAGNTLFDLFYSKGGVLNFADLAKVRALAYVVYFE